jgi:diacylglycerol kinase (ATP)
MLAGRIAALLYSIAGLVAAWKTSVAFRLECVFSIVLVPLAFWAGESGIERVILIVPVFFVLIVELLNSAIEATVDRIGPDIHPLSKQAKDMGSAAVFVALLVVVVIWALVLF